MRREKSGGLGKQMDKMERAHVRGGGAEVGAIHI